MVTVSAITAEAPADATKSAAEIVRRHGGADRRLTTFRREESDRFNGGKKKTDRVSKLQPPLLW